MNIQNMLIVAYMKTLKLFVSAILLYDEKAYLRKLLLLPKAPRVSLDVDIYFIINT